MVVDDGALYFCPRNKIMVISVLNAKKTINNFFVKWFWTKLRCNKQKLKLQLKTLMKESRLRTFKNFAILMYKYIKASLCTFGF